MRCACCKESVSPADAVLVENSEKRRRPFVLCVPDTLVILGDMAASRLTEAEDLVAVAEDLAGRRRRERQEARDGR